MVKAYLRYEPVASLGCIATGQSIVYDKSNSNVVITAALEKITFWNTRTGDLIKQLSPLVGTNKLPEVTSLALSPDGHKLAAGHSDGSLRVWDTDSNEAEPSAPGHHTGISALRYSSNGSLLASGGQDTSIVIWDVTTLAPLHRLQGHTGQITSLAFLQADKVLITGSKDGYLRAWDLNSQHCFQTISSMNGEVWGLDAHPNGSKLVAGYATAQLQVFDVTEQNETASGRTILTSLGIIQRSTPGRSVGVHYSPDGQTLACVGSGKAVELYQSRSEAEVTQRLKRRKKRKREKLSKSNEAETLEDTQEDESLTAADVLAPFQVLRCKSKVKGIAFPPKRAKTDAVQCALTLSNNSVEVWNATEASSERLHSIDRIGHRSGVRALTLSSDGSLLLTAAESSVKVWNPVTLTDIRDIPVANGLSLMMAPGNKHAVVGTKEGTLEILDIGAGESVSSIEAHKGAVWAVSPLPDNSGLVSGSADHEAKFWEWEVKEEAQEGAQPKRTLSLRFVRSVKMSDDVLAVKISPDGRLIALSLLDSTIQILFLDTLKLKGSLYGHKLPVLTMDISSDSALLVSGSADKNIKIWGLDFNDCHKSIFAHDDSIMQMPVNKSWSPGLTQSHYQCRHQKVLEYHESIIILVISCGEMIWVAFVPNTHYAFTVGKDKLVKYWDLDRWELLLELPSHHAEVWCLAISNLGDMVVTGSADRTIRIWERTDEPFFAEEEKENRIESLFETEGPNPHTTVKPDEGQGPAEGKAVRPGLETASARAAMDNLADSLEDAGKEVKRIEEFQAQHPGQELPPNPLLLGLSPEQYVLRSLGNIRSADLEQALLLLPFSFSFLLLEYLCFWLEKGIKVELSCRVAVLLVRLHHDQLVSTSSVRPVLLRTKELLQRELKRKRNILGFNAAGVTHLLRQLKQRQHQLS